MKSTDQMLFDALSWEGLFCPGADLTNRRGKRPLRALGNQGAPSDIHETYLSNTPVCICVMESVKYSLTVQNGEFLSGAEFCKLMNPLIKQHVDKM